MHTYKGRLSRLAVTVVALGAVVAACGDNEDESSTAADAEESAATSSEAEATAADSEVGDTVTVYLGRHYGIEPVFESFTEATGIEVRFTTGGDPELRERLIAEGANTPADVVITADAANIELSAQADVLAAVDSEALAGAIPAELRSPDNLWFSLSQRARVVIYSTERVTDAPTTYADVGDPRWQGRLCLRPSTHPYTQSLAASIIAAEGEERAAEIVASWVANDPLYINSDTDMYLAVEAGDCDMALANSYYLGRLQTEDPDFPVAIQWPEQDGRGAHVNVSAGAVTANAPNPEAAQALLEWLATEGQSEFVDVNFEYPADPNVATNELVASWGEFTSDLEVVHRLGELNPMAVEQLSVAGYE
jgi:iron(III) transport system substrate-binding protein